MTMASVFCDAHGILSIDYLEKGKTINGEYYMALLVRLKEEIAKTPTQCTVSQVDRNNGKIAQIAL